MKRVTLQQSVEPAERAKGVATGVASHTPVRETIEARDGRRELRGAL